MPVGVFGLIERVCRFVRIHHAYQPQQVILRADPKLRLDIIGRHRDHVSRDACNHL
jgi:hypothetical protein